jgi:hypothetical protein
LAGHRRIDFVRNGLALNTGTGVSAIVAIQPFILFE